MRKLLFPLVLAAALHAGVTDFHTLSRAEKAYNGGHYGEASSDYGSLQDKNDEARFNYGDALYKQKKYKEAAAQFAQIKTPALKQKSLYNLGNSLANLGKIDDAIKAYENALKLGKDADAQYNLDLLKKQQKQQKKQQQNNKQNQKKKDQKQQNQQKNQQQNGQGKNGKKDQDKQKSKQNQQNQQNKSGKEHQKNQKDRQGQSQEAQKPQQKQNQQKQNQSERSKQQQTRQQQTKSEAQNANKKKQAGAQAQPATAQPISDMEENKYNKMLDKRGIKTLMIPLSGKGEPHEDDKTPW